VLVTRYSSTYHPRTYRGLLATDGKRHRLAFYWFDPVAECEQTDSLAFSDFLFHPDKVSYWHHKDANERHTLVLGSCQASQGGQLPKENTLDSILQSILSLVVQNRAAPASNAGTMETARFFQTARQHDGFDHTVEPLAVEKAAGAWLAGLAADNFRMPNQLPFGRKYSKQIDQEGSVVWCVSKTTISRDVVKVTVKPKRLRDVPGRSDMFDPNALGRWSAVPEPYRKFWSFKHRSIKLRRAPSVPEAKRLYTDIDSCLRGSLPDDVKLALHKLWFKASLETGSSEAMSSSARQYFQTYMCLAQQPVDLILVELGRIAKELRKKWSDEQTGDFILPLLRPLVDPKVFNRGFVDNAVFDEIRLRGRSWSLYGQLVLESIQEATSLDPEFLAHLAQIVESLDQGVNITDSEPNEDNSVKARREAEHFQKRE
jgi:hypothetical protein